MPAWRWTRDGLAMYLFLWTLAAHLVREKVAAWHADARSFRVHLSRSAVDRQLEGKITLGEAIVLPVK